MRHARRMALAVLLGLAATTALADPPAVDAAPPGVPVQERLAEIQRRVQSVLVYPESARARGVQGEARMGFEVGADGRAANVALLESSGSSALDRAAERAVRDARALPSVLGRVSIPVRFELVQQRIDTSEKRRRAPGAESD